MYTGPISSIIYNNDVNALRHLLNQYYYESNFPTMDKKMVDNLRLQCIYLNKQELLKAFR